jgi:hypothetical protein
VRVRTEIRRAAPWVLCGVTLGLLVLAQALRWLLRDQATTADVDWVEGVIGALGFVGIPVVGALIASRLPGNVYGWLWCAAGLAYAVSDVSRPLVRLTGWPGWIAWLLGGWAFVSLLGLFVLIFLLFPTGRLPTPGWRWIARPAVTVAVLLLGVVSLIPDPDDPSAASPWAVSGEAARVLGRIGEAGVFTMLGLVLVAMCPPWWCASAGPVRSNGSSSRGSCTPRC